MKINKFFQNKVFLCITLAVLGMFLVVPSIVKAQATKKIKISVLGPMKFYFGEYIWRASELTADLINKQGGINVGGVKHLIELVSIDTNDLLSVSDAVNAMERASTIEKSDFIISGARSEATLPMMDIAADHKKIFIDVNSAHPDMIKRVKENYDRYKYFFRFSIPVGFPTIAYSLSDADYVGQKIKKELGIEKVKVALVIDKAAYADPIVAVGQGIFPAMGYEIAGIWRPSYSEKDLFAEASAVKASGAQLIWAVMSGPDGQAFVNAWAKLKVPAAIVGTVTDSQRLAFWKTTGGACNYIGSYDAIGRVEMSPATLEFYDRYFKKYGDKPGWNSPFVEGALMALKGAIERAGSLEALKIIPELEKTDIHDPIGRLKFYPNDSQFPHQAIYGEGYRTMVSFQWRNGKQIVYFPAANEVDKAIQAKSPESAYLGKLKFKGTGDYILPPWMVEFWKKKK
jgi:branched-chain amino acid transport system substrate-binding protein